MLREIQVSLDELSVHDVPVEDDSPTGKALAVKRLLADTSPENTVYLTGYTPLAAAGFGFAGKLNVYGISLLGNNLQGSRSGGIIAPFLTRAGIVGIGISGTTSEQHLLHINQSGESRLLPLSQLGSRIVGTYDFAHRLYARFGNDIALALTDPATTGFDYNAIVCNAAAGYLPQRTAGRSTTIFGKNGLVAIVIEKAENQQHNIAFDRKAMAALLRQINKAKANITLTGSADPQNPLLGGTYGAAALFRFDQGHGLTNLFRDAHVPEAYIHDLLPETIVREQINRSAESGIAIRRHSCLPGCPNRCSQMVIFGDRENGFHKGKAGEWETYQGLINLGIFKNTVELTSRVIEHSNNHAWDHIEGLVTLAALALASELKEDTGVRYGDAESVMQALSEAAAGDTDLGQLVRKGAAAVENHYGLRRHFTVGGHALPFHNGRSIQQTGIGLSWSYGRHGESCAGPGRHNFLGEPYNAVDRTQSPESLVLNTIHGMIMYGAMDDLGLCFFMGPSVDSLVDNTMVLSCMGIETDPRDLIRSSANRLKSIHDFNRSRRVTIQPLPDVFYERPTRGNAQTDSEAVAFTVPFDTIRTVGEQVLTDVAEGRVTIPPEVLDTSRSRYDGSRNSGSSPG